MSVELSIGPVEKRVPFLSKEFSCEEMQIEILSWCDIPSLVATTGTCRHAHRVGNDKSLWRSVLKRVGVSSKELEKSRTTRELKRLAEDFLYPDFDRVVNYPYRMEDQGLGPNISGYIERNRRGLCPQYFRADNQNLAFISNCAEQSVITCANYCMDEIVWEIPICQCKEEMRLKAARGHTIKENLLAVVSKTTAQIWNFVENAMIHCFNNFAPKYKITNTCSVLVDQNHLFVGLLGEEIVKITLNQQMHYGKCTMIGRPKIWANDSEYVSALYCFGERLFSGHRSGKINIYDLESGELQITLSKGINDLPKVSFLALLGRTLISKGQELEISPILWDLRPFEKIRCLLTRKETLLAWQMFSTTADGRYSISKLTWTLPSQIEENEEESTSEA